MAVVFKSYAKQVINSIEQKKATALEIIGGKAESYAKKLCPVGTPESTGIPGYVGGRLRNSITHQQMDENTEVVGTNVEYAPYVELGTYKMTARPFLRPAAENHNEEYQNVFKTIMHV